LEEQYVYPSTKERIVLRSFFFCLQRRGLRSEWPDSPIGLAEVDHPVGWAGTRMEKRLKSGLEPFNLTSQGYEVTSSVYKTTTLVHLITSIRNQPTSFGLYR